MHRSAVGQLLREYEFRLKQINRDLFMINKYSSRIVSSSNLDVDVLKYTYANRMLILQSVNK